MLFQKRCTGHGFFEFNSIYIMPIYFTNGNNKNKLKNGKYSPFPFSLWSYIFRFPLYFRFFRC